MRRSPLPARSIRELGGPPVRIPIEPEVYDLIFTEHERDGLWPVHPDMRVQNRRGIYLYNKRSVRLPLLSAFDQPDAITSCPVRPVSTHALQALSLFNSSFMQDVSRDFAARLSNSCGDNQSCAIDTAWRLASRAPAAKEESKLASSFLAVRRYACRISVWRSSIETSFSMSHDHISASSHSTRRAGARRPWIRLYRAWRLCSTPPAAAPKRVNPLAPKPPHFAGEAKSVIFLFMVGGPSQIDTFDPKPALDKFHGQKLPDSYGTVVSQFTKGDTPLLRSPVEVQQIRPMRPRRIYPFPNIAQCVDDICFVRNFYTDSTVHAPAMYQVQQRTHPHGLSEHGIVGHVRTWQREREPACLCRDAAAGRHSRRRHAVLGRRLPAGGLSRHGVPLRSEPDPESAAAGIA